MGLYFFLWKLSDPRVLRTATVFRLVSGLSCSLPALRNVFNISGHTPEQSVVLLLSSTLCPQIAGSRQFSGIATLQLHVMLVVLPQVRFVEQDLDCVAGLIGLQTIASVEEHEGSRQLFLFEQLTHLDRSVSSMP